MSGSTEGRESSFLWWGLVEIIVAIVLSVGASVVATYSRIAVIEAKTQMLEISRIDEKREREKIGDGIKAVDGRLQRIEQAMARVEAKLERP